MRKIFTVIALLSLGSCLQENSSSPAAPSTFIRYFNGGNNDTAQAMEVTPDGGYIILATTTVKKTDADKPKNKIKLIKTDKFGNQVWQSLFPSATDTTKNYTGSSLQLLPEGGYVITGEDIQTNQTSRTLVMKVSDTGAMIGTPATAGTISSGRAVAVDATGYLVLSTTGQEDMRLQKLDKNLSTVVWTNEYTAGVTNLARRLFIDEQNKVLWAGGATKSKLTGIRMVKTAQNAVNTDFDLLISVPGTSEVATDFCRYGFIYAIVGGTFVKDSGVIGTDTEILFKRLNADGTVLSTKSFGFDGQNDFGNSITSTADGGLILLATVGSEGLKAAKKDGQGDNDYYLIKIDGFGGFTWDSSFGSRFRDDGVTVRQAADGGYVVLGTTTQGQLRIITLIKTDINGKIQ